MRSKGVVDYGLVYALHAVLSEKILEVYSRRSRAGQV